MEYHSRRVPQFSSRLEAFVQSRNIREGFALLDEVRGKLKSDTKWLGPSLIPFALCVAQWMDLGYHDHTIFDFVSERLPKRHSKMAFLDVMRLNLIEAYSCFSGEDPDRAISLLEQT